MYVSKTNVIFLSCQIVLIVLLAIFARYDEAHMAVPVSEGGVNYSMFQDVHVMIFVGFGFLMTFLHKYGYSTTGYCLLLAAIMAQWSALIMGLFDLHDGKIGITLHTLLEADIAAAAFLISVGVVLGKTSPLQLLVIGIVEIVLFAVNEYITYDILQVSDIGGTMVVHTFGAYFGLALSFVLYSKDLNTSKQTASYPTDITSMIGTVFLWCFWPSFNAGLSQGVAQERAIINTYFSLAACTVATFVFSWIYNKKLEMEHIQNSTLAGGVAVGAAADMVLQPFGAMIAGTIAAFISTTGYSYMSSFVHKKFRIHDTCGVNYLHGLPGLLGAIVSIIASSLASKDLYGDSLKTVFPAMMETHNYINVNGTQQLESITQGRSASTQATYQLIALGISLAISIVGGAVTGLLIKMLGKCLDPVEDNQVFDDASGWLLPGEEHETHMEDYKNPVSNASSSDPENIESEKL